MLPSWEESPPVPFSQISVQSPSPLATLTSLSPTPLPLPDPSSVPLAREGRREGLALCWASLHPCTPTSSTRTPGATQGGGTGTLPAPGAGLFVSPRVNPSPAPCLGPASGCSASLDAALQPSPETAVVLRLPQPGEREAPRGKSVAAGSGCAGRTEPVPASVGPRLRCSSPSRAAAGSGRAQTPVPAHLPPPPAPPQCDTRVIPSPCSKPESGDWTHDTYLLCIKVRLYRHFFQSLLGTCQAQAEGQQQERAFLQRHDSGEGRVPPTSSLLCAAQTHPTFPPAT